MKLMKFFLRGIPERYCIQITDEQYDWIVNKILLGKYNKGGIWIKDNREDSYFALDQMIQVFFKDE